MQDRYSNKRRKIKSRIKHKYEVTHSDAVVSPISTKANDRPILIPDYKTKFHVTPSKIPLKSISATNIVSKPTIKIKPNSIVCDASSIITLTDAGLIGTLLSLVSRLKGNLLVTDGVVYESVTRPWNMPQYSFSAVRIKRAIDAGFFKPAQASKETTNKILYLANHMFTVKGKPLRLVHLGEAEMLAVAVDNKLNTVLMDERTTRTLIEAPLEHRDHLQREFGRQLNTNTKNIQEFKELTEGIKIIRSAEVIVLANDASYFHKYGKLKLKAYESALLSMKFHGCSVSFDEITEIVNMASRSSNSDPKTRPKTPRRKP